MFPIPNPLTSYEIIQFLISYTFDSHSNLLDVLSPSSLRQRRRSRSKRQKQISIMMIKSRKTCYGSLFLFLFIVSIVTTTIIHGKPTTSYNDVVIAIGISNNIYTYKRFVGSLRHSDYNGLIILARPGPGPGHNSYDNNLPKSKHIETYLQEHNVTIKYIESTTDCHNHVLSLSEENEQLSKLNNNNNNHYCIKPYTNLRMSWSSYALARDWLHHECVVKQKCSNSINGGGGRVLLSPLHHIYFQRNPFTDTSTSMTKNNNSFMKPFLYLYEDHPSKTINDNHALLRCKKFLWDVPFISSIVYSDVSSMSFYLENVIKEAYEWMNKSECYLSNSGIAIHNYLFYNGVIRPNGDDNGSKGGVVRYREGIVNSVDIIGKYYREYVWKESDDEEEWTKVSGFLRKDKHVDERGYFLNADGTKSAIVLHFEAFGLPLQRWLFKQDFMTSDNDAMENQGIIGSDNPLDNPFFYLLLESSRYSIDTDKVFLRKRYVMGKVVH